MSAKLAVVPNFNLRYMIDTDGVIYSYYRGEKRVLKPYICGSGYYQIKLHRNGKRTHHCIHNLVANAFIKNSDSKKIWVNHIDGNKLNNRAENLEWVTPSENTTHYHKELKDKKF